MTDRMSHEAAIGRLETLCAARRLDGVARSTHQEGPAIATSGSVFAHLPDPATLALACPVEQKVLLLEIDPDVYFETEKEVGKPLILIRLGAISDEELSLRLDDAWTLFATQDQLHKKASGAGGA